MPVVTSYPGIYIQELPSNTHTIAAAPTSVTVFVGYVHPFKPATPNYGTALEIFSFSDYERLFGGFYQSAVIDANVSYAVNEFFQNGGTDAIIVGLQPTHYYKADGTSLGAISAATQTLAVAGTDGIEFTALEPTDTVSISVTINNVQKDAASNLTIADLTITYGAQTEVYRKISLDSTAKNPNFLDTRVNGVSGLVTVKPNTNYPAAFGSLTYTESKTLSTTVPVGTVGVFNAADFLKVFQEDSSLDKVQVFNLLLTPGVVNNAVLSEALAFCERKLAFFIMDPPKADVADPPTNWVGDFLGNTAGDSGGNVAPMSANGALYFPYLLSSNPVTGLPTDVTGATFTVPPSGFVAGIYAATDSSRGVWKAPAGLATTLLDTTGVVTPGGLMTDSRQGVLNTIGVNCIRSFPGAGTVVFGARTLVSANVAFQQWKYVPVRRMALFLEQTLKANLPWVIFEPNDEPLWVSIRTSIESFMLSLFNQGAFAGSTPSDSFQVKCDSTTTTPDDQANGVVNIIVGFAPLRPAEFVVVKIAQLAGQVQS
jgi:phage tail sheath protein FI